METLYFTLGIASVVVTVIAVVAVWAMFKVAKLNSMLRDVEQQYGSTHRDITMVEHTIQTHLQLQHGINNNMRDIDQRIESLNKDVHDRIDHIEREAERTFSDVYRTIDSRIDKLAAKQEKQLIKG